ncbi:MAG: DUF3575 domain-containing protein [Paludibacteraceae bacterium]|nr:DUF3575 domain-containing protein [Paludibacteraceae bacterium]
MMIGFMAVPLLGGIVSPAEAQTVVLKNNLLYDAALTPNLSLEVRLAERWTLQFDAGFNPFPLDDAVEHKWRHVLAGIEAKYWFKRAFRCDFIGVNTYYTHFNVAGGNYPVGWLYPMVKTNRVQGDAVMAGLSYGWIFPLSKHVGIELEAGVDGGYAWFNRYECAHCGALLDSPRRWFAVPKAGVNIAILLPHADEEDCPCRRQKEDEQLAEAPAEPLQPIPSPIRPYSPIRPIGPIKPLQLIGPIIPIGPATPLNPSQPFSTPLHLSEPISAPERLNSPVLHSFDTYQPYTTDMVLARDSDALYVFFEKDSSVIKRHFDNNAVILDSIIYLVSELMKDSLSEMKLIQIVGCASFDGPLARNQRLAWNRARALKNYISKRVAVPDELFELNSGEEAWADVIWRLEQSDYVYRDALLQIIREEPNLDLRERKIKQYHNGEAYRYLKDQLLRKFRNSGYIKVYYELK